MEIYDFRNTDLQDQQQKFMQEIDTLNKTEFNELVKQFEQIKEKSYTNDIETVIEWFDLAILPVLKDFAELTSSILEIERGTKNIITANIKNTNMVCITESCICFKMVLLGAAQIAIDRENEFVVLSLIFDCNKFI